MRVRPAFRPYFFEILALAHVVILWAIMRRAGINFGLAHVSVWFPGFMLTLAIACAAGVGLRLLRGRIRNDRRYLHRIRSAEWLLLTARMIVIAALSTILYGWLKLLVPVLNPVSYDGALWEIDRALLLGHSPNVLFLEVFRVPWLLRFVDWSYGVLFLVALYLVKGFFLSYPSSRVRVAFANGYLLLWIVGAWLYLLVPSMGPAYRFPDVWAEVSPWFEMTRAGQRALLLNYLEVGKLARGESAKIILVYGIAAFPSLHVGFQMFAALWMRKLSPVMALAFDLLVVWILFGSVVTGWHYLIDGLAGIALAYVCYRAGLRITPMTRKTGSPRTPRRPDNPRSR